MSEIKKEQMPGVAKELNGLAEAVASVDEKQQKLAEEIVQTFAGERDEWRRKCMLEEDNHTATKVALAKYEVREKGHLVLLRQHRVAMLVFCVGMIVFGVLAALGFRKAAGYEQLETGLDACMSIHEKCEKERDDFRGKYDAEAAALVLCTTKDPGLMPQECPPAPQCPNGEGVCDQQRCEWHHRAVVADLARCTDWLAGCRNVQQNRPPIPITLGEAYAQQVEQAKTELAPVRAEWDARMAEFAEVFEQAKAAGVGPRARDWVTNPEAVRLYVELTVRWAEIEQIQYQVDQRIRGVHDRLSNACWTDLNELKPLDDVMPDWRTFNRLREEYNRIADERMFFYICKDEIERQQEAGDEDRRGD